MAQNIILKRSALPGKVPDTGSLNLGEIALNTYDGRAFIHKSGSTESIEQIVVTNSTTTGSITITQTGSFGEINVTNDINVSGSVYVTHDIVANGDLDVLGAVSASIVSASMYYGDGSQLTGISAGATDSEIPSNDWDYNLPDSGSLSDGNNISTKYTVDFQAEGYGTRPVGYQTFITNTNGSTEIIPGTDSIVFIVNNREVGRIDVGGIIGNTPLGTISSSAQIAELGYVTSSSGGGSTDITALNTFTASANVSISNLNTFTASISTASLVTSINNLNTFSASVSTASLVTSITNLNTTTASLLIETSNLEAFSSSVLTRLTTLGTYTGSVEGRFTTLATLTGSNGVRLTNLETTSASVNVSVTNLNTATASINTSITNINTFSASVLTRLTTIGTYTSSLNTWTSSVATTGSNSFNGNQTITGSLTVSSVAVVSASVTLPSGSILSLTSGSSLLVQNSGLVEITGSLVVSGSTTINNYRIDDAWTSYSVAWTSDGTAPALNNGTLTGYYKLIGKTCFVRVKLLIGSTSTMGTGAWQFSLPFTAASFDGIQFPCSMLDNTVAWFGGFVNGTYGGFTTKSSIICTTSGTHAFSAVGPNNPFTWGTGDSLMFNGSYEIA